MQKRNRFCLPGVQHQQVPRPRPVGGGEIVAPLRRPGHAVMIPRLPQGLGHVHRHTAVEHAHAALPVAQQTAERFMNQHPEARVTVTGGGTGVGISALMDHTTDIAMASRPIKFSEKMKIKGAGEEVDEVIVAYDALAVVVHPSNPVKQLTRQQLEDIFRGKINNWKQVGGDDRKIVVYSRETSSGTYEFFKESVLKNKNYMASSLSMPATGAIIQSVSQTKGAIGYVGLAYVSPRIKTLSVSYDGTHYATPTVENATNKTYPIVRPLYYYYNVKNKEQVSPVLAVVSSIKQ